MEQGDGENRTVALCVRCESVYAARVDADGTVLPIGISNGCPCGSPEFVEADVELDAAAEEHELTDD